MLLGTIFIVFDINEDQMSIYICMKVVIQHVCRFAILGLAGLKPVFVEVQIELDMIIAINDSFSYYFLHVPV